MLSSKDSKKHLKIRIEGRVLVKLIIVSRKQMTGERKLSKKQIYIVKDNCIILLR